MAGSNMVNPRPRTIFWQDLLHVYIFMYTGVYVCVHELTAQHMLRTCAMSELLYIQSRHSLFQKVRIYTEDRAWKKFSSQIKKPIYNTTKNRASGLYLMLPDSRKLWGNLDIYVRKLFPISFLRTTRLDWSSSHPTRRSAGSPALMLVPAPACLSPDTPLLFLWTSPSTSNASPQKVQGTQQREQRSHVQRKLPFVRETCNSKHWCSHI